MSDKFDVEHPIAGRTRRGRAATDNTVENPTTNVPANITGATAKMQEILNANAKENKPAKEFNPSELKDLKDLIFLGRQYEVVHIAGYKFEISTLTNAEKRMVIKELATKGKEMASYVQSYTLAMSIQKINDVPLDELYEEEDAEELTEYQRCTKIIDSWQSLLIGKLYSEYERINTIAEGVFSKDADGDDKLKK